MCDYSLMGVPNRLANEGEDLVVYRFPTGSRGLTPSDDHAPEMSRFRSMVRWLFEDAKSDRVAVCIPPGARLRLTGIPDVMQKSLNINANEEVTFTQLTAAANSYRDAIRFNNGCEVLLQKLKDGQPVKVLQLALTSDPTPVWNTEESLR